jgi:NADPH2:quinone reductase
MKALLCEAWGGPERLRLGEMPAPAPGPGQVAIAVHACGVNFADTLIVQGRYQEKPEFPFSPGLEVSGVVSALGDGVDTPAVGERVMALTGGHGGMAETVCVPAAITSPVPEGMDFATAAGFSVTYGTAHVALDYKARLQPGETLLVHGAGGGVGLAAVEIGKLMGATVIANASTEDKRALALAHGADHAIDSAQGEGLRAAVKGLTGGRGADVILDPVGGAVFDESVRCIAWDGRLLVIGFASGSIPRLAVNYALVKSFSVMGLYWGAYARRKPEVLTASWRQLLDWYAGGRLKPHVGSSFPLADAAAAIAAVMNREARGKVVVRIRDD